LPDKVLICLKDLIMSDATNNTGTVTRADLAEALYLEIGLSRTDSSQLVESLIDHVSKALEKGEHVKLERRVLVFKPSQVLRERVDSSLSPK